MKLEVLHIDDSNSDGFFSSSQDEASTCRVNIKS